MNDLERAAAFAPVLDRLGKLLPRLASDHAGEVVATVAAIGRTLQGVGLDFHDLARRIASPTSFDTMAPSASPRPPQDPEPAPRPAWSAAPPAPPPKPRRPPSPWPTWSTLSHFGRLGMFDTILAEADLLPVERDRLTAAHEVYRRQQIPPSAKDQRAFNGACRMLWEAGWRPTAQAA